MVAFGFADDHPVDSTVGTAINAATTSPSAGGEGREDGRPTNIGFEDGRYHKFHPPQWFHSVYGAPARRPFSTVLTGRNLFGTILQPLRVRLTFGIHCATQTALISIILFLALNAHAQSTNDLSDAEIQGRALVQQILEQQPTGNQTNTGVLLIRGGRHQEIPITCNTVVTPMNWQTIYRATLTNRIETLLVVHTAGQSNLYYYNPTNSTENVPFLGDIPVLGHLFPNHQVAGAALMSPFAGSEFLLCDLGLEFFQWPEQKVLKKDVHRSRGCTVLESTNPSPGTNGYSRVVSWIDNETLGIVDAYAYDANGVLMKDFYPKDFKKVKGQWQVQTLVMENWATGSSSRLEFDLTNE